MDECEQSRVRDIERLGAARDRILDVIGEHEQLAHEGGCCLEDRVSAVAFIAHSLGFLSESDESWEFIRAVVMIYEAHHA